MRIIDPTSRKCLFCSHCFVSEMLECHVRRTHVFWHLLPQSPEYTSLVLGGWEAHIGQNLLDMVASDKLCQISHQAGMALRGVIPPAVPLGRLCLSCLQHLLDAVVFCWLAPSLAGFSIPRVSRDTIPDRLRILKSS